MYDDDDMLGYDPVTGAAVVVPRRAAMPRMPNLALRRGLPPGGMRMVPPGGLGVPLQAPPPWRTPQLAPGVMAPFEGLVPLQLTADVNAGVLTSAFPLVNFTAQPQKPFRGQRIVAVVNRSAGAGASSVRIQGGIFIGTDLQGASFGDTPLETFAPTAFGVDLVLTPAGPGITVRIPVIATPAVPAGETIAVSITILGRYIA